MPKSKKIVFLLSLVFVLTSSGMAERRMSFGFEGGFAFSNHWSTEEKNGDYSVKSGMKLGFDAGVMATYKFSEMFTLQAGINYVSKGSHQTINVPGFPFGDIRVTYKLDYVEFPVLLRTYLFRLGQIEPSFAGGAFVAFLRNKKYLTQIEIIGTSETEIKGIKSTDFGFASGAGLDIPGRNLIMRIDYR
jgi:hypothetical protein